MAVEIFVGGERLRMMTGSTLTMETRAAWADLDNLTSDFVYTFTATVEGNERLVEWEQLDWKELKGEFAARLVVDGVEVGTGVLMVDEVTRSAWRGGEGSRELACSLVLPLIEEGWGSQSARVPMRGDGTHLAEPDSEEREENSITMGSADELIDWLQERSLRRGAGVKLFMAMAEDWDEDGTMGLIRGDTLMGHGGGEVNAKRNVLAQYSSAFEDTAQVAEGREWRLVNRMGVKEDGTRWNAGGAAELDCFQRKARAQWGQDTPVAPAYNLVWVVRNLVDEAGYRLVGSWMEDSRVQQIYHQSIYTMDDVLGVEREAWEYHRYLPTMTRSELLTAVAKTFGLAVWWSAERGVVELEFIGDVLAAGAIDATEWVTGVRRVRGEEKAYRYWMHTQRGEEVIDRRMLLTEEEAESMIWRTDRKVSGKMFFRKYDGEARTALARGHYMSNGIFINDTLGWDGEPMGDPFWGEVRREGSTVEAEEWEMNVQRVATREEDEGLRMMHLVGDKYSPTTKVDAERYEAQNTDEEEPMEGTYGNVKEAEVPLLLAVDNTLYEEMGRWPVAGYRDTIRIWERKMVRDPEAHGQGREPDPIYDIEDSQEEVLFGHLSAGWNNRTAHGYDNEDEELVTLRAVGKGSIGERWIRPMLEWLVNSEEVELQMEGDIRMMTTLRGLMAPQEEMKDQEVRWIYFDGMRLLPESVTYEMWDGGVRATVMGRRWINRG